MEGNGDSTQDLGVSIKFKSMEKGKVWTKSTVFVSPFDTSCS